MKIQRNSLASILITLNIVGMFVSLFLFVLNMLDNSIPWFWVIFPIWCPIAVEATTLIIIILIATIIDIARSK